MLLSAIHKLINSVWNKEELPEQWKESIIVPIRKKGDKTDCKNYSGISLLSTSYKISHHHVFSSKHTNGVRFQHLLLSIMSLRH
jgi:hypothetical protein